MAQLGDLEVALEDIVNCCLDYSHHGHVRFVERSADYMPTDAARLALREGAQLLFKRHISMIESSMRVFQRFAMATFLPAVPGALGLPTPELPSGAAAITEPVEAIETDITRLQEELAHLTSLEQQLEADLTLEQQKLQEAVQSSVWVDALPKSMQDPSTLDKKLAGALEEAERVRALLLNAAPFLELTRQAGIEKRQLSGTAAYAAGSDWHHEALPDDSQCALLRSLIPADAQA